MLLARSHEIEIYIATNNRAALSGTCGSARSRSPLYEREPATGAAGPSRLAGSRTAPAAHRLHAAHRGCLGQAWSFGQGGSRRDRETVRTRGRAGRCDGTGARRRRVRRVRLGSTPGAERSSDPDGGQRRSGWRDRPARRAQPEPGLCEGSPISPRTGWALRAALGRVEGALGHDRRQRCDMTCACRRPFRAVPAIRQPVREIRGRAARARESRGGKTSGLEQPSSHLSADATSTARPDRVSSATHNPRGRPRARRGAGHGNETRLDILYYMLPRVLFARRRQRSRHQVQAFDGRAASARSQPRPISRSAIIELASPARADYPESACGVESVGRKPRDHHNSTTRSAWRRNQNMTSRCRASSRSARIVMGKAATLTRVGDVMISKTARREPENSTCSATR